MAVAADTSDLDTLLGEERERWILWIPVALLLGISLYFWLPDEPWPWSGPVLAALLAVPALLPHRHAPVRVFWAAGALMFAGVSLAQFETWRADGPLLEGETGPRPVEGTIAAVDVRDRGVRIVLDDPAIPRLGGDETPKRVRISVRTHGGIDPVPGDRVRILAILGPPPPPTYPGGFDFAREAFFDGIGATGYAVGPLESVRTGGNAMTLTDRIFVSIEALRAEATERILGALPDPANGVAAALLTGQRGAVDANVLETIRAAGLAHLLAISGLHLGLVAAILFFTARAALAAIEPVALRAPIKTWAAGFALAGAGFYLLISGMTVPTQRAFLMTAIVLLAVSVGRQAISLRLVALAAVVVMALSPHAVVGASFQLSFAAVVALVAVYEALRDRWPRWRVSQGPFGRLVLYFGGVGITTLVASLATTPLVLIHFGRVATYGLLANLLAVPITAFWVMPWGLLALVLIPFGLESLALAPMGWGIDAVLAVAGTTTALPGSRLAVPAAPAWLALPFGLGLAWLCIWRRRWRLLGLLPVAACLAAIATVRPPDILITEDAGLVAVRLDDRRTAFSSLRRGRFVRETWLAVLGRPAAVAWPVSGETLADDRLGCDSLGCLYRPDGMGGPVIAIENGVAALDDDCGVADLVISAVPIRRTCPAAWGVIDRFDLWRGGTHAIWIEDDGVTVSTVTSARGGRPWTPAAKDQ